MGAFLCVSQGSPQVPWFLEIRLNCPEKMEVGDGTQESTQKPVVLVGKGENSCSSSSSFSIRIFSSLLGI